ncbi:helix-turn-helix transcriptional regulator [Alteromonas sp. a30]|uniref:helix-turn-helix transcriptional regulator n=1 Tax=Alteromonas sp. a30 TaxID=2730917 RepID=UPI002280DE3C|nr:AraC family transcriptional regulator [Alteromonas sp. a30]MCY7296313.1 helix-turn-helix domain-containing protein [Alteromonas sp. a30]
MSRCWFELDDKIFDSHPIVARLIDLAVQRGANCDALLRGTGIFYQDVQLNRTTLSYQQISKLIANAEKQVTSQDLSFLLGRRLFPSNLGDIGLLLSNTRHLNNMLRMMQCFQILLFPYLQTHVERHEAHTYLILNPAIAENDQLRFFIELLCAAIHSACKWQLGEIVPLHFYFTFPRPRNIYQYEENLGFRLHFSQSLCMISAPNEWLYKSTPESSKLVRQQKRLHSQQLRNTQPFKCGLIQYVCERIRHAPSASLEDIAEQMHISPATLKRKLKQHGTQFQKLQDRVRMQSALFDLKIRGLGNKDVAQKLGFSDLANFRRAFKRWTGMTPKEVKQV